jgi:cytochrome c oxidase subunit 2
MPGRLLLIALVGLGACAGPYSTLAPAGPDAQAVARLWWWMAAGALVVWLGMLALLVHGWRVRPRPISERAGTALIIGGGVVFPVVVLVALLVRGIGLIPVLRAPGDADGVHVAVVGEQWWWRVRYHLPGGDVVETANEVRLPAGRRTGFTLSSADVIHSFWIPSLGGKMDMTPGRETDLALEPTRTGTFRGWCAEYCGASHALMRLDVEVMEPAAFDAWLDSLSAPAARPADELARRGGELFVAHGCGACHTIRGTAADGRVGPDLTHLGRREHLGAGALVNGVESLMRWISWPEGVKPGAHMPPFGMLDAADLLAVARYLDALR